MWFIFVLVLFNTSAIYWSFMWVCCFMISFIRFSIHGRRKHITPLCVLNGFLPVKMNQSIMLWFGLACLSISYPPRSVCVGLTFYVIFQNSIFCGRTIVLTFLFFDLCLQPWLMYSSSNNNTTFFLFVLFI